MLTLTDRAAGAIHNLTTQSGMSAESAGLRIVASRPDEDPAQEKFSVTLKEAPDSGDEVIVSGPARVFLESGAAEALDDQQLDATVGRDGGIRFVLTPQK